MNADIFILDMVSSPVRGIMYILQTTMMPRWKQEPVMELP